MRCAKCNRPLRHPVYFGGSAYGSHCARAVCGAKPKRQRAPRPVDESQCDLFAQDLQYAQRVDSILAGISLEMPR
jgi:recombinational DNA repair protein (RecF pathway)